MITGLIRLARPRDWIKNVFVLLPVPFALKATGAAERQGFAPVSFCLGFVGFLPGCVGRLHVERPVGCELGSSAPEEAASADCGGRGFAVCCGRATGVLLVAGLGLCVASETVSERHHRVGLRGRQFGVQPRRRNVALLDVFLLSSGFVLRVLLGCALVTMPPSPWLLLCTSTLALFLGFTKRRADLSEDLDSKHRPSLRGYSKAFLDQAMSICAGVAILAYALYCIEAKQPSKGIFLPGRENWPRCPLSPMEFSTTFAWSTSRASAARRSTSRIGRGACRPAPSAGCWP